MGTLETELFQVCILTLYAISIISATEEVHNDLAEVWIDHPKRHHDNSNKPVFQGIICFPTLDAKQYIEGENDP
jgi:hypothetical protein